LQQQINSNILNFGSGKDLYCVLLLGDPEKNIGSLYCHGELVSYS